MSKRVRYDPDLGCMVKLCVWCGEEWPLDEEFFYRNRSGWFYARCRACASEANSNGHRRRAGGPMYADSQPAAGGAGCGT